MLRLILGLVFCLALPGCDQQAPAVTIDFWAMGREGELVRALTEDFERQHPGIRVRVQQVPWSAAHEKLLTAYAGDAMPDVFQLGTTWVPEFVALDAITPLDDRIDASPSIARDDFFAGIVATNEIDGRLYGIPWYVDTRLLFYRSDLLGAGDPPRSWADWRVAMATIQQGAGPGADAIMLPSNEWAPTVILGLQMGGELLAGEAECGNFQAAGFRTALAFQLSLFEDGFASALTSGQMVNLYQEFANGRFGMYITGPWNLGEFERRLPAALQDSWATTPMPSPDGMYPGVSLAGGASLAIQRQSPYQKEAWQLVEYLSATAQQVRFHQLSGNLPARLAAWQDPSLAGDARTEAFFAQLQRVRPTPKIPEWERIATAISRRVEQLIRGETTLDLALEGLDAEVDAMLEKRRWLLDRADPGRAFAGVADRCQELRAAS